MKKKNIIIPLLFIASLLASSCNDFLDKMPDNRAELTTEQKITRLLVSAYPSASFSMLAEMMSDNTQDNGTLYSAYSLMDEEAYHWQDVTEVNQDSPQYIWDNYYLAIASANHAIKAIEDLGMDKNSPQKGEALLCRAYAHFILVNLFCQHYNTATSTRDMGIPYVEEPETIVSKNYDRGTVADVYAKIAEDIEAGLPLIDDQIYTVPRYHFNYKAACAFAARFYLWYEKYDKVIRYATLALGETPDEVMRDFNGDAKTSDWNWRINNYVSAELNSNLLLLPAKSYWPIIHGPYSEGERYGHARSIAKTQTFWSPGLWGENLSAYNTVFGSTPKMVYPKLGAFVEYTDKVAGTGFINLVYPAFTTDEAILCRAEAYVYRQEYAQALADMQTWLKGHTATGGSLSLDNIKNYYAQNLTTKKPLHPKFALETGLQESFIHFILHCRRIENIHEGLRWFDIKRYGIEIAHNRHGKTDDVLTSDDLRRAIQIPSSVISAGMPANPR